MHRTPTDEELAVELEMHRRPAPDHPHPDLLRRPGRPRRDAVGRRRAGRVDHPRRHHRRRPARARWPPSRSRRCARSSPRPINRHARAREDRAHPLLLRGPHPGRDRPGPRRHREPGVPDPHQGRPPAAVADRRQPSANRSRPVASGALGPAIGPDRPHRSGLVGPGSRRAPSPWRTRPSPWSLPRPGRSSVLRRPSVVPARPRRRRPGRVALLAASPPLRPPPLASADGRHRRRYRPPVDGPIVDRFDPPAQRWQAGNRGVDYGVAPGTAVVAGGRRRGRLRRRRRRRACTSPSATPTACARRYSFLAGTSVHVGPAGAGRPGGRRGRRARCTSACARPTAPTSTPRRSSPGRSSPTCAWCPAPRTASTRWPSAGRCSTRSSTAGRRCCAHLEATGGALARRSSAHYLEELEPVVHAAAGGRRRSQDWLDQLGRLHARRDRRRRRRPSAASWCSSAGSAPTSDGNSAWELDTGALGYDAGGRRAVLLPRWPGPVPVRPEPVGSDGADGARRPRRAAPTTRPRRHPGPPVRQADSQQSVEQSAAAARGLLTQVARGRARRARSTCIAHSQGGVVARLGVVEAGARRHASRRGREPGHRRLAPPGGAASPPRSTPSHQTDAGRRCWHAPSATTGSSTGSTTASRPTAQLSETSPLIARAARHADPRRGALHVDRRSRRPRRARHRHRRRPGRHPPSHPDRRRPTPTATSPRRPRPPGRSAWPSPASGPPASRCPRRWAPSPRPRSIRPRSRRRGRPGRRTVDAELARQALAPLGALGD